MEVIIIAIVAYLIGSVNFSVLISKKMAGFDVREKGSKNGGTTNVLRTIGKKAAILTLIADISKGIFAILMAWLVREICKWQFCATCANSSRLRGCPVIHFRCFLGFEAEKELRQVWAFYYC